MTFHEKLKFNRCHCGGELTVTVGYSCPLTYICKCKDCKDLNYHSDPDEDGINVLSGVDAVKKRPHMYLDDPKWGKVAREEIRLIKMTLNLNNLRTKENDEEVENICECGDCRKIYRVSDLASETESESWEMPQTYTVHFCPKCEDGGHIEDYWYDKRPLWLIRSINFIGYNWRNNVWKK